MNSPLAGVRVIEMAGMGPTPFCATMLADLGADVIRVDRPDKQVSAQEAARRMLGRGTRSVALDLKRPDAVAAVLRLAAGADLLIEGFRPGVMERLGLGPEACQALNPKLVYGRMTGWGQTGPLADTAGHDINYIAITGALASIGGEEHPGAAAQPGRRLWRRRHDDGAGAGRRLARREVAWRQRARHRRGDERKLPPR